MPSRVRLLILATILALSPVPAAASAGPDTGLFEEVAAEAGLDFVHFNGMVGELYYSEMVGSGGALFDYDNDGDLDVYLVQGNMLEGEEHLETALFPPKVLPVRDRLYRNDLDAEGKLSFTDVTESSGLDARGYGMGVTVGDVDNDGWLDLYVTNHGSNQLWRSRGRGDDGEVTFEEVTASAGADDSRWSAGAAFFDFDRDGWLDLYVVNYVDFHLGNHKACYSPNSALDYCGPESYRPVPDRLLRNTTGEGLGSLTFADVTVGAGLAVEPRPGLAAVAADFDGDGWQDIYVANDGTENFLWRNRRDGSFEETALISGSAVNLRGEPEAGMGVDAADYDEDGDEDLFVTHLRQESNTLYTNDGSGNFRDDTARAGLRTASLPFTSFGTGWLDFDGDGRLDLLVVSGAVLRIPEQLTAGNPHPLDQPNQLFRNVAGGRFEDVSAAAGAAFRLQEVSRGAAFGDVDNDGDLDVLVTNNNGPVRLLLNRGRPVGHWVGLRLVDPRLRRDTPGARAVIEAPGQAPRHRRVRGGGSYASASDLRILAALDASGGPVTVRVGWPDGANEEFRSVALDEYSTLRRGEGSPLRPALEPLPSPPISGLEEVVVEHLSAGQEALARALEAEGGPPDDLGGRFGDLGRLYQAYLFPDAAAACYRNASALAPEDPRWPYYLGRLYLEAGSAALAGEAFESVLALRADDLPARLGLGRALFDQGRLGDAQRELHRSLEQAPGFAPAHDLLGELALSRHDFATAVEHYRRALAAQPQATRLHHQLAAAYRGLGELERAAEHMRLRGDGRLSFPDPLMRELRSLNRSAKALVERGLEALEAGRLEAATASLRQAVSLRPEYVVAHLNLGTALVRAGRLGEAVPVFEAALRLEPEDPTARFNLATVLARLGDDPGAVEHYLRAIRTDPNSADLRLNLANALSRVGRVEEALGHYERARELEPFNSTLPRAEAVALARLGRFAEARERLEEGLQAFPEALPIADALARLLAACPEDRLRDGPRALRLAERTFEAERTLHHVETLAMAYAELGDFDRAIVWQRRAIEVAEREERRDVVAQLSDVLEAYADGRPVRSPWPGLKSDW